MAENILHFGAVRFRVNGQGNMQLSLFSLDDYSTYEMKELPIVTNGREPMRQCNFNSQRARLKISTNKINEHVKINRIVILLKNKSVAYPM